MAGNAPLVIISGSGSWPPFLEFVDYFNKLQEQFCGYAAFACVYLSEFPLTFGIPVRVTVEISVFGRAQVEQGACRMESDLSDALTPYDDTYHVVPAISFGVNVMISVAIDVYIAVIGIKIDLEV